MLENPLSKQVVSIGDHMVRTKQANKDLQNQAAVRTQQLEQALIDIQADKCRIQRLQEDLVSQVEEQKIKNAKLKTKLNAREAELEKTYDTIKFFKKEMVEKDDENIVVHMCVQKLQDELQEMSKQLSEKEGILDQKEAYIRTIQNRLDLKKEGSFPKSRDDLIKSLATENASSV